ncbi:MAG: GNAT family N-acetyltransferase, partial [Actinobacteria bacterium]|nr:GNAT family N-acetyltransferase [Actinomycetota bacterium]
VAQPPVIVRRGGPRDQRFLRDMLHHAYYWKERSPGEGPGPVALYSKGFGRRGDTAVVAVVEGFPVGAAWYRVFSAATPGYGFVDEATPELAIGVVPSARGKGVGSALLDALVDRARGEGRPGLSLAVDRQNAGAIALYERRGFERVRENEQTLVMLRTLPVG